MGFSNLKGTTHKSFRIGARGITIASMAIKDSELRKRLADYKNDLSYMPYEDRLVANPADEESIGENSKILLYDTDIPNSAIVGTSIVRKNGRDVLELRLKEYDTTTNTNKIYEVALDGSVQDERIVSLVGTKDAEGNTLTAEAGDIVIFDDASGRFIKSSNRTFKDEISESGEGSLDLVSEKSVINYVGKINDLLKNRLTGNAEKDNSEQVETEKVEG